MRYLKTYRLYESNFERLFVEQFNRIKPDIEDILITLKDSGIKYHLWDYSDDNIGEVGVDIEDKKEEFIDNSLKVTKKFFTWNSIKKEILHLISYMNSQGIEFYKLDVQQFIGGEFRNFEMYEESELEELEESIANGMTDNFRFTNFSILFCKQP